MNKRLGIHKCKEGHLKRKLNEFEREHCDLKAFKKLLRYKKVI